MKKKHIIIGITGGIAAFKAVQLCSNLMKQNFELDVIMTKNACEFIQPLTIEALIKKPVYIDTFAKSGSAIQHVSLADTADLFLVVPATANFVGKVANGICDDLLTTTFLACDCKKMVALAMNTRMYDNLIFQENVTKLLKYDIEIIDAATGLLACEAVGKGKLAPIEELEYRIHQFFNGNPKLKNKKIAISLGACREAIDPVRFISNHSSGKMGVALAKQALEAQMDVTLVVAHTEVVLPVQANIVSAVSALEMDAYFKQHQAEFDVIIMCAAVSDYRVLNVSKEKIKKTEDTLTLNLVKNLDILQYLGEHRKPKQVLVGFSMESENVLENSRKKLLKKHCDFIVANSIRTGVFGSDFNEVTIIREHSERSIPQNTKELIAKVILEEIEKEI